MVNFLTEDFFHKRRIRKYILASLVIIFALGAFAADRILAVYLENRELEEKIQIIEKRSGKVENNLEDISHLEEELEELEKELEQMRQETGGSLQVNRVMEELSALSFSSLQFKKFSLDNLEFNIVGITDDMTHIYQLVDQMENNNFFQNYYIEDITETDEYIHFAVSGEIRRETVQ
ncbi:MAG: PilN domain-containing protein [Halanaerobiales bacterium]